MALRKRPLRLSILSEVLSVFGLRYSLFYVLSTFCFFILLSLLLNFQRLEDWVYRNQNLSIEQQNQVIGMLGYLGNLRLDQPLLGLSQSFRELEQGKEPQLSDHPYKIRSKNGQRPLSYFTDKRPLRILLIGDSLADSIRVSLEPMVRRIPSLQLDSHTVVSSTLTNNHFVNWFEQLQSLLRYQDYDVVLVFLGANSCQGIRLGGGRVASFPSQFWYSSYSQRIKDFVEVIRQSGADPWWIINPPMRKVSYQKDLNHVLSVQRDTARALGMPSIETQGIVGDEKGNYLQSKVIDGRLLSLRSDDGVHFTYEGSRLISQYIVEKLFDTYNIRLAKQIAF